MPSKVSQRRKTQYDLTCLCSSQASSSQQREVERLPTGLGFQEMLVTGYKLSVFKMDKFRGSDGQPTAAPMINNTVLNMWSLLRADGKCCSIWNTVLTL